jgi:hypothetical protein
MAEWFVIDWLAHRGGADAMEMAGLLQEQRWYKAVLTIDHFSNESEFGDDLEQEGVPKRIWERLQQVFKAPVHERWKLRMEIARLLQERIVSWFKDRLQGEAGTIVYEFKSHRDKLEAQAAIRTLFLLDVPDPTKAFQQPLYFTRVERRVAVSVDPVEAIVAVRSYDGQQLSDNFVIANGHIRLLCHPDFDEFVERSVPRRTLLSMVCEVLESATTKKATSH